MVEPESVFKVVLIGDAGTGKTHLLNRFVKGAIPKGTQPTIGVEFAAKNIKLQNGQDVKVQFWDTAGQERYRSITISHYRKSIGALLVYDVTKENTYDNVTKWMEDLKLQAEPNIVIMLVGNKIDLCEKEPDSRKVDIKEAENFAKENNLLFTETSAITSNNVNKAFENLIEAIYNVQVSGQRPQEPVIELNEHQKQGDENKNCSC